MKTRPAKKIAHERAKTLMGLSANRCAEIIGKASQPIAGQQTRRELRNALEALTDSTDRILFRAKYGAVIRAYTDNK